MAFKYILKEIISLLCYIMENNNLLDLNDDILNFIGKYVEKDNYDRIKKEKDKQDEFEYVDKMVRLIKREFDIKDRPNVRKYIYQFFADCGVCKEDEVINEYLTLRKLNLKRK